MAVFCINPGSMSFFSFLLNRLASCTFYCCSRSKLQLKLSLELKDISFRSNKRACQMLFLQDMQPQTYEDIQVQFYK